MLQASQAFGAPAYLAQALGCAPQDVYQWIAGAEDPGPDQRRCLEMQVQGALERRAVLSSGGRRWSDQDSAFS